MFDFKAKIASVHVSKNIQLFKHYLILKISKDLLFCQNNI